jgi:hypothetical protein
MLVVVMASFSKDCFVSLRIRQKARVSFRRTGEVFRRSKRLRGSERSKRPKGKEKVRGRKKRQISRSLLLQKNQPIGIT